MRYLVLIKPHFFALLLLLITGTDRVIAQKSNLNTCQAIRLPFSDSSIESYQYKASMKFYKNKLTGIFVIKPLKDNTGSFRVVFLNELGMKYFDFTITNDSFKVNQCLQPLKKANVLKILSHDLKLLLLPSEFDEPLNEGEDVSKCKYKSRNGKYILFFKPELAIKKQHDIISGAKVYYSDYKNISTPGVIIIKHGFLNIQYEFNYIYAK